jgi:hypothetical protein
VLGCTLLGGLLIAPLAVMGVLSSGPAGASGSAESPITQAATAPGNYLVNITVNTTPTPFNLSGTLTILPTGSFTSSLNGKGIIHCSGIWTTSGKYIAMEISGTTAPSGCIVTGVDWVLAGHLYGKGIKSGTLNQWFTDANGVPTTSFSTGTWRAVKG